MKRATLLIVLSALVGLARAGQPPMPHAMQDHIEFKSYGFYSVINYTYMHAFTNESGQYMNPLTGQIIYAVDNYALNGLTAVAGWMWRTESAVGVGFSYLNDAEGSFSQIPVFLEYRAHFLHNRLTPFCAAQIGYSIPFGSKNKAEDYTRIDEGGVTFGFEVGLRLAVKQKIGLNIYAGYQLINCNSVERGFDQVAVSRFSELYEHYKFGVGINF